MRFGSSKTLSVLTLVLATACSGNLRSDSNQAQMANGEDSSTPFGVPFVPFSPQVYTQRIKALMTGQIATSDEVAQVTANESALSSLVTQWQTTPAYQDKIKTFLNNALQHSNVITSSFDDQGAQLGSLPGDQQALLLGNLRDMMSKTVLTLDAQGQPFKTTMTTRSFMLTPPLMAYYAYLDNVFVSDTGGTQNTNGNGDLSSVFGSFVAADYSNWKMVTIRQPNGGEATTNPTDTAGLKGATTMVLKTPRIGFWSTPTWFAGWQTNAANQARVTMNQTLIVALGHAFDGTLTGQPKSLAAIDTVHAQPSTDCYGCHINLDPARQFLRQAYTIHFSPQKDANQMAMPGQFAFNNVNISGTSIADLGDTLANHPDMPAAWVGKVCSWANDMTCLPSDPEVIRLGQSFAGHGSFSTMVREVLTSPISTWSRSTLTATTNGISLSVSKTDHLCPLLAQRLNLTDPCGLAPGANPQNDFGVIKTIASALPSNAYSRGQVTAVQATDPSLFFRSAAENICLRLANQLVEGQTANASFASANPDTAVRAMVTQLMGISGADAEEAVSILRSHYDSALATTGANTQTPQSAMRSTFTVACLSPAVMGTGMGI